MIRDILTYRGREGYWTWVLHRATGVAILLFLLAHIVDTLLVFWPNVYEMVLGWYHEPVFRLGEVVLVGIVTFHAVNGIRVTVIDFWSHATENRRAIFYAAMALFAILFIPALILMLRSIFAA